MVVAHLSMKGVGNTMGTKETWSDTGFLWRRSLVGPNDPSVGERPKHWEHLPPTKTKIQEGKAKMLNNTLSGGVS